MENQLISHGGEKDQIRVLSAITRDYGMDTWENAKKEIKDFIGLFVEARREADPVKKLILIARIRSDTEYMMMRFRLNDAHCRKPSFSKKSSEATSSIIEQVNKAIMERDISSLENLIANPSEKLLADFFTEVKKSPHNNSPEDGFILINAGTAISLLHDFTGCGDSGRDEKIRAKYHKLALKYHPDKLAKTSGDENLILQVLNQMYEIYASNVDGIYTACLDKYQKISPDYYMMEFASLFDHDDILQFLIEKKSRFEMEKKDAESESASMTLQDALEYIFSNFLKSGEPPEKCSRLLFKKIGEERGNKIVDETIKDPEQLKSVMAILNAPGESVGAPDGKPFAAGISLPRS